MARESKAAVVAEITESLRGAQATVLTEYRGLTVAQMKELRVALGGENTYAVVKNTLTKIAAKDAGIEGIDDLLVGPSALAFITGDPVEAAKGLRTFAKENPALVIKGGVMEGRVLTAEEISKLADLESREVLLAKLAGAMKASLSGAAGLFAAPLAQSARLLAAYQAKLEEQGPAVSSSSDAAEDSTETTSAAADVDDAEAPAEASAEGSASDAPAAEADQG
jgi:large subunit ribosomal protein L10